MLRWEWQPGATLFVVWQQTRESEESALRTLSEDARALGRLRPDNVFAVKLSYWLNL